MKKTTLFVSAAVALSVCMSCSKIPEAGLNDASKTYFDAWIKLYYPEAKKDALGFYTISEKPGNGVPSGDAKANPYICLSYTKTDLDGNIVETTDARLAQQVGTYSESDYYGPVMMMRGGNGMRAGLEGMIEGMKAGGTKTSAVPGWLDTQYRFDDEKSYLDNITGTDYIYSITLEDVIPDISAYQIDSIESYISRNIKTPCDSVRYGYYYIQTKAPDDDTVIEKTSKVYVNYTGRLLNGKVFDTTDEKTAKDALIYSYDKSYEPYQVTLQEDFKEMDTVQGFSYCVSNMKKGEKGICIFYSTYGYGGSSQSSIPAFSPLRFDLEMIGTEK